MALGYPQPRTEERLLHDLGQLLDKADPPGSPHWQGTVDLTKTFLEGLARLLDAPALSTEQWSETVRLLKSYLEWLAFRTRG